MAICNKDCENCPFDDCINDEMDAQDYRDAAQRDKLCMTERQKKMKAQNRRSYLKKKEEKLAYSRAYYRANKEKAAAYQKAYRAEHRGQTNARNREYERRNRGAYGQKQRILRIERLALGLTQKQVAKILGVSPSAISQWERGVMPCRVEAVLKKLHAWAKQMTDG